MITVWEDFKVTVQAIDVAALDRAGLGALAGEIGAIRAVLDGLEARVAVGLRRLGVSESSTAETLRRQTGCSAREAKHRTRRAETLDRMPSVADALSSGRLTGEHASALARAAAETSPEAVDRDAGLLAEAESLPADVASRKTRDWVRRRQTGDDLQLVHQWQRRNRSLQFGDGEGGMIAGFAKFDQVSGAQFQSLVESLADRLYRADGGRDNPHARTRAQCRLDALMALVGLEPAPLPDLAAAAAGPGGHAVDASGHNTSTNGHNPTPSGRSGLPETRGPNSTADSRSGPAPGRGATPGLSGRSGLPKARGSSSGFDSRPGPGLGCSCGRGSGLGIKAQLCIVMDLEYVATEGERGRCEIPGAGALARSELERLGCDADIYGIIFDGHGVPLYHGRKTRRVSPQQWRALVARDRGCVICGAKPSLCQAHHVKFWSRGGRTDIDNLALLCHDHHRWVHDNEITLRRDRNGWHVPTGLPPPRRPGRPPGHRHLPAPGHCG